MRLSNKLLGQGYVKERLKSSLRKFYGRYGDLTKQYEVPLSRMLHDILDDDHIQWHPPLIGHYTDFWPLLIWTLLPNLTFYLIVQGFHRTYATGAAFQQRTLTPPDTWSCPTLGLACVLMSRPISPELVLSPDFWISNTPRYFSFAYLPYLFHPMEISCVVQNQLWKKVSINDKILLKLTHIFSSPKSSMFQTIGKTQLQRDPFQGVDLSSVPWEACVTQIALSSRFDLLWYWNFTPPLSSFKKNVFAVNHADADHIFITFVNYLYPLVLLVLWTSISLGYIFLWRQGNVKYVRSSR